MQPVEGCAAYPAVNLLLSLIQELYFSPVSWILDSDPCFEKRLASCSSAFLWLCYLHSPHGVMRFITAADRFAGLLVVTGETFESDRIVRPPSRDPYGPYPVLYRYRGTGGFEDSR